MGARNFLYRLRVSIFTRCGLRATIAAEQRRLNDAGNYRYFPNGIEPVVNSGQAEQPISFSELGVIPPTFDGGIIERG
mgnify:CR=1 FL=1|jgi:hypothetical protein